MAMIKCPECGKEISSTAMACPNCGYVINSTKLDISPTPVPNLQKKPISGIMCIIWGIVAIIIGIPLVSIVIGIFVIIGGLALVGVGVKGMGGVAKCTCPYCRATGEIGKNSTSFRCNSCRKTSILRDGHLYPSDS